MDPQANTQINDSEAVDLDTDLQDFITLHIFIENGGDSIKLLCLGPNQTKPNKKLLLESYGRSDWSSLSKYKQLKLGIVSLSIREAILV